MANSPAPMHMSVASALTRAFAWLQVTQAGDSNRARGSIGTTDALMPSAATPTRSLNMASGGYTCHSSVWCPEATVPEVTPHGSQVLSWSGAAAWSTNTNMASPRSFEEIQTKSEPFLIPGLHHCPEPEESLGWAAVGREAGRGQHLHKLQAVGQRPADPTRREDT